MPRTITPKERLTLQRLTAAARNARHAREVLELEIRRLLTVDPDDADGISLIRAAIDTDYGFIETAMTRLGVEVVDT